MKNITLIILLFICTASIAQVPDGQSLIGLHNVKNSDISSILEPVVGSMIYNITDKTIYLFNDDGWKPVSSDGWKTTGNSSTNELNNYIGTTDLTDFVLKANSDERLRLNKNVGQVLINKATSYNTHPLIIRANGNDILAFQDNTGTTKWHWNMLNNGLNFVESGVADYRLFLKSGGNIGIDTNAPEYSLDVNGTAKIEVTPTITTATKALVKNPATGQISEQEISLLSINGKYVMNFTGRAYFFNNRWYSPSSHYGVAYQHWNHQKGSGNSPTYSTTYQFGVPIPSDVTLARLVMKNDFNASTINPRINLSIIRSGSIINIGTYNLSSSSTTIFVDNFAIGFSLLANDLLVWSTNSSGANRYNYTSLTFEFTY